MLLEINGKQWIGGFLCCVALLAIITIPIIAYETGKQNPGTRTIVYRDRVVEKVVNSSNDTMPPIIVINQSPAPQPSQPSSVNIQLDKKGECIMVNQPNGKDAIMRCTLI